MKVFKKIVNTFFVLSVIVFGITFFLRHSLPNTESIVPQVLIEPLQEETDQQLIKIDKEEFTAQVTTLYKYELHGLIVSQHNSDVWYDYYHESDPFNTRDLCVVWGDNVQSGLYKKGKYKSGDFTCYWKFKTGEDFKNFLPNQVSNNHLIPANDQIEKKIKKAKIGDQISFKGFLSTYSTSTSDGQEIGSRGTSTTREDTGDNSCEVVYVTDFSVLQKNNNIFSVIYHYIKYSLAFFGTVAVILFFII